MTIELDNVNGKIVGIDTETGEQVPISLGDINPDKVGSNEDPAESVHTGQADITDTASIEINVPSDYSTVTSALDRAVAIYKARGTPVEINIESGYEWESNPTLTGVDARHIRIKSEDPVVEVEDNFSGNVLQLFHSSGPEWDVLLDQKGLGSKGLSLNEASSIYGSGSGSGIINSGDDAAFINRNSTAYLHEMDFSGASGRGIFADHACLVYARGVTLDDCGDGLRVRGQSYVEVQPRSGTGSINNCSNRGIECESGSEVYIGSLEIQDARVAIDIRSGGRVCGINPTLSADSNEILMESASARYETDQAVYTHGHTDVTVSRLVNGGPNFDSGEQIRLRFESINRERVFGDVIITCGRQSFGNTDRGAAAKYTFSVEPWEFVNLEENHPHLQNFTSDDIFVKDADGQQFDLIVKHPGGDDGWDYNVSARLDSARGSTSSNEGPFVEFVEAEIEDIPE